MTGLDVVILNLLGKHPLTVPLIAAGTMLGYKSANAIYAAKCRGTFPLMVGRTGAGLSVKTADLIDCIQGCRPVTPNEVRRNAKPHAGRPTKSESLEAARRNITVKELRAQSSIELQEGRGA